MLSAVEGPAVCEQRHGLLQVLRLQSCVLGNLLQRYRAKFFSVMPGPCVVGKSFSLKLHMGTLLLRSRFPPDTKQGPVNTDCLTARPRSHKKRMDFGDFLICSVRSAITRRARAVTFTSASCSVVPYAITPGSSGTSASHRPSFSRSKIMLKDSPSGGCGNVAISISTPLRQGRIVAESICRSELKVKFIAAIRESQVSGDVRLPL
jgi:hypothetical protein